MNPPAKPDPPIGSSNTNPIDLSSSDDEIEPNAPNTVEQNQLGRTTSSPMFFERSADGRPSEGPALANSGPTSTAMSEIDEVQDGAARSVGREALLLAYSKRDRALAQMAKMERNIPKFRQKQSHYSELQSTVICYFVLARETVPDATGYVRFGLGFKIAGVAITFPVLVQDPLPAGAELPALADFKKRIMDQLADWVQVSFPS